MKNIGCDIVLLLQARIGSRRLPGKSMLEFKGVPVLEHIVIALLKDRTTQNVVVLTSRKKENDIIRKKSFELGIKCYSGDEENVASRFKHFLEKNYHKYFVRINGDSPLLDYRIIKNAINNINDDYDVYSTIYTSKFPSGLNFEIIKSNVFLENYKNFVNKSHYEHVTKYFYENDYKFNIKQIEYPHLPTSYEYKFSLDTIDDKNKLVKIFNSLNKDHFHYNLYEKCLIYDKVVRNIIC